MFITEFCCCLPCLPFMSKAYARCRLWDSIHNSNASGNDTNTDYPNQKFVPRHACLNAVRLTNRKGHGRPRGVAICRTQLLTSVVFAGVCLIAVPSLFRLNYSSLQPHCRYAALCLPCPVPALPCRYAALPCLLPASLHLISPRHTLPAKPPCLGRCTDAHAKLSQR